MERVATTGFGAYIVFPHSVLPVVSRKCARQSLFILGLVGTFPVQYHRWWFRPVSLCVCLRMPSHCVRARFCLHGGQALCLCACFLSSFWMMKHDVVQRGVTKKRICTAWGDEKRICPAWGDEAFFPHGGTRRGARGEARGASILQKQSRPMQVKFST